MAFERARPALRDREANGAFAVIYGQPIGLTKYFPVLYVAICIGDESQWSRARFSARLHLKKLLA
jgi:hypothetical protein